VRLSVFPEAGFRLPESRRGLTQGEFRIRGPGIIFREAGPCLRESGICSCEAEVSLTEADARIPEGQKVIRESGIHLPEAINRLPLSDVL
jgi:hypothetical protein